VAGTFHILFHILIFIPYSSSIFFFHIFPYSLDPTTEPRRNVVHVYYQDPLIDELGIASLTFEKRNLAKT